MSLEFPVKLTPEEGDPDVLNVQGLAPMEGVITFGEGKEAACEMARDALTGVLAVMLDDNLPIPKPPARESVTDPDVVWIQPSLNVAMAVLLRWAREDAGLSQVEVAQRLGVKQQSYQRLEKPDANPSVGTLEKAFRAIGKMPVVTV